MYHYFLTTTEDISTFCWFRIADVDHLLRAWSKGNPSTESKKQKFTLFQYKTTRCYIGLCFTMASVVDHTFTNRVDEKREKKRFLPSFFSLWWHVINRCLQSLPKTDTINSRCTYFLIQIYPPLQTRSSLYRHGWLGDFSASTVSAEDRPKLEIDRKVMQYRRYEKSYPNSTCREHCDAKKGLVPYLQVRCSLELGWCLRSTEDRKGTLIYILLNRGLSPLEQQQLLSRLQEMRDLRDDSRRTLPAVSERHDAKWEPFAMPLDRRENHWLPKSMGCWSHGFCFVW